MKLSPLKLGIIGATSYGASVAWVFLYFRIAGRNDPAGWIIDRSSPEGPRLMAIVAGAFYCHYCGQAFVSSVANWVNECNRLLQATDFAILPPAILDIDFMA
jgi:hypothetical protein